MRAVAAFSGDFMRKFLFFVGGPTMKQGNKAIVTDNKLPQNSVVCKKYPFIPHSCIYSWLEFSRSRRGLLILAPKYRLVPGLFHMSLILLGPTAMWNLFLLRGKAGTPEGKANCTNTFQAFDPSLTANITRSKQATWPSPTSTGSGKCPLLLMGGTAESRQRG